MFFKYLYRKKLFVNCLQQWLARNKALSSWLWLIFKYRLKYESVVKKISLKRSIIGNCVKNSKNIYSHCFCLTKQKILSKNKMIRKKNLHKFIKNASESTRFLLKILILLNFLSTNFFCTSTLMSNEEIQIYFIG